MQRGRAAYRPAGIGGARFSDKHHQPTINEGELVTQRLSSMLLVVALFATASFAQEGINATLSGVAADPSGALVPGVQVTAKNTATGVTSTTLTNESGTYRFPSLQPG